MYSGTMHPWESRPGAGPALQFGARMACWVCAAGNSVVGPCRVSVRCTAPAACPGAPVLDPGGKLSSISINSQTHDLSRL